jgi:hypothetical protein
MRTSLSSWQPAMHAVFGQLGHELKAAEGLDVDSKIRVTFFKTDFRVRARLAAYSKFLDLFEVEARGDIRNLHPSIDFKGVLKGAAKRNGLEFPKKKNHKEKLQFWFDLTEKEYQKLGHYKIN